MKKENNKKYIILLNRFEFIKVPGIYMLKYILNLQDCDAAKAQYLSQATN